MNVYTLGLYEKAMPDDLSWREKLLCAKACGYDFLEISIDESDLRLARLDWNREERLDLVRTMYETGLPIRSMCLSGHRRYPLGAKDPAVRARGMEIMEKAIALADDLGIRIIQLAGYDAYYEKDQWSGSQAYFSENLARSVELAAAHGIALGFETMETPFMNTVWKSMFYVSQNASPWLGVYPDCGNLNNAALSANASLAADLSSGRGHILAMHLKPTKPGIFRDLYFDDPGSRVDFPLAIQTAWDLGVRRFVTELWYQGSETWQRDIVTANQRMREIISRKTSKTEG